MEFQRELQSSKQVVRAWVRAHFSDQRLASVVAFNEDGRMGFRNPCGCLMGVTYSDRLHDPGLDGAGIDGANHDCDRKHYWRARRLDLSQTRRFAALFLASQLGKAEKAYLFLGFSANCRNCFGDDDLRRRRFSALLRAEMRRRARLNVRVPDDAPALATSTPASACK